MTTKNNIPQGYKQTELGIIPQEWEVKRIKDICEVDAKSLSAKTSPDYEFEYISLSDVGSDLFDISTSHQIFRTAPSRARRIVSKGDVVISTVRPNLQGFFLVKEDKKDLIASTGFAVLTPTECDSQYLLSCFFSQIVSKQFYSLMVGSNYPAVNSSDVAKLKLPVPPLAEQKKIAEILGVWDEAIEKQNLLIEKLELRKRALMQRLLTGKTRLHGFTEPWQKVKLGEICNITTGKLDANAMNIYGIYPFFTCAKEVSKINQFAFDTEALLISGNGEHLGYVHYYKGKFNAYQRTYVLNNFTQNIFYMFYTLKQNLPKRILQTKSSSNTPYIIMETLTNMEIALPNNQEQKAIAEVLTTADDEIAIHRKTLDALRLQKRGLMQQLLTGKIRVKI